MATVLSPDSSPSVVYNTEGRTLGSYAGAGNWLGSSPAFNDAANATVITKHAQTTVALVSSTADHTEGVLLDTNYDIGDEVELTTTSATNVAVYFPAGDTVNGHGLGASPPQSNANFYTFLGTETVLRARKVATSNWLVYTGNVV